MKNRQARSLWISIYSSWSYSTLFYQLGVLPLITLNCKKELENRKTVRKEGKKFNDECFSKVGFLNSARSIYLREVVIY
jgi:hypothetical protein